MSQDNANAAVDTSCCASCGIPEVDDTKLMECNACDLVRYCSIACQRDHIPKHLRKCTKRVAELREELLFKQPASTHREDCPICMSRKAQMSILSHFLPSGDEQIAKQRLKRIELNDPVAITSEGLGLDKNGDYVKAFECYTKAAALGDIEAHHRLAMLYHWGQGVEKDKRKEMYHFKEAAVGGHPTARHNLGCDELNNGNPEKAAKHWIIAATHGNDDSIKGLMMVFKGGAISKEVLAAALRANQAAVDAAKSPQRDAAEEHRRSKGTFW
eukprot:scaffold3011_cov130-Skeletonema_marinoi.AAC.9